MQHQNEPLQLIIENTFDLAIVHMDAERLVTLWNVGAERLLGWVEGEILGLSADSFFTGEDRAAGIPELEARTALEQGRATDERWYVRKDGSRFWGSGLLQPVYEAGKLAGYAKIFRDLTSIHQTRETLRENRHRLEMTLSAARIATWDWDSETDRITAFGSASEILGLLPGEPVDIRAHGFRLIHPDDRESHRAHIRQALRSGTGWHSEFRIIRPKDGRTVWLEERATVTREPHTGKVHATGLICDITDRKYATERDAFRMHLTDTLRLLSDPGEIEAQACRMLGEHLGVDRAYYAEVEENDEYLIIRQDYDRGGAHSIVGRYRLEDFSPRHFEDMRAGLPNIIPDIEHASYLSASQHDTFAHGVMRSLAAVGLMKRGRLATLLTVTQRFPRNWSADEVALIEEAGGRVWAAIERARYEQAMADDLKATSLLRELGARMVAESNVQTLYQEILAAAMTLTSADAGTVQILDHNTNELVLQATQNFDRSMTDHFHRLDASSHTSCGVALARGQRVFLDFDVPESEDPDGSLRMHVEAGYLSAQSTPLIAHSGRPIGMISTHWRDSRRLTDRDLRFFDLLVRQAADLIEHRQAEAALRAHQTEIEALNSRLTRAMQETHHRIKNNLQVIAAIVEMESYDGGAVSEKAHLRINTHVRALATIHDLLTQQARTDADMTHLDTAAMLQRLISMLQEMTRDRPIRGEIASVLLPIQQSAALALLVNELVSNALKHGSGDIEVTLQVSGEQRSEGEAQPIRRARLEVCDRGPGFPEGFDSHEVANTGLELIDSAARWDLRGDVSYENRDEGGTRVIVTFPIALEQAS